MRQSQLRELRQLRTATVRMINENPTLVVPLRQPLVTGPEGNQVRSGARLAQPAAVVRIILDSGDPSWAEAPGGTTSSTAHKAVTDGEAPLLQGDQFTALGYTWDVGPVETFAVGTRVYRTVARLTRGSAS